MKALVIHAANDIRWETRPDPEPTDDEVRLRIRYVGLCGSDLHYYFHGANGEYRLREPFTPGHELSAVVDHDPLGRFAEGTPVTVHPARYGTPQAGFADRPQLWPGGDYLGSAAVFPHRQGGASEYLVVDRTMLRSLPSTLSLEHAALAEPLAVALHAIAVGHVPTAARVLVLGVGPIGLLVVAALRAAETTDITAADVKREPLARASHQGASATLHIGVNAVPDGHYDVVFEASGTAPGLNQAIQSARPGGRIVQVGILPDADIPVNLARIGSRELELVGSFRFADELTEATALLAAQPRIADIVTHVLPAEQAAAAFDLARDATQSGKVLLAL